jgi:hypothetical protein
VAQVVLVVVALVVLVALVLLERQTQEAVQEAVVLL